MEIKLKKDSWHYKLNTWSQEETPSYTYLCPYFWLTIWNILTCIPRLPFRAMSYFIFNSPRTMRILDKMLIIDLPPGTNKTLLFFSCFGGFLMVCFGIYTHGWSALIGILVFVGSILISLLLIYLFINTVEKGKDSDLFKMLNGMYNAFKNKVCPFINWED